MAFTQRKRDFAAGIAAGMSATRAAIAAGYSENGAAQSASRLMKDEDVLAALERLGKVSKAKEIAKAEGKPVNLPDLAKLFSDPKDFLLALMNDPTEEMKLRVEAAKTLMPFTHRKKGESGKNAERQQAAQNVTGIFGVTTAPPAPRKAH